MKAARPETSGDAMPFRISNRGGGSPVVIVCDHASNRIPAEFGTLGLDQADLARHIAWDPGALPVAERLMERLDAPLVASTISRLVIDCNRTPDAPDAILERSEDTAIPSNCAITAAERARRVALFHAPYHRAIETLASERVCNGISPVFLAVHTFTPVYSGKPRPWHVGIIHDGDDRLAGPLAARLAEDPAFVVGVNEPYSPRDGVYYTLARHASSPGLMAAMIEIRNDLVADATQQRRWGDLLSSIIRGILSDQPREAPSKATTTMLTN